MHPWPLKAGRVNCLKPVNSERGLQIVAGATVALPLPKLFGPSLRHPCIRSHRHGRRAGGYDSEWAFDLSEAAKGLWL